MNDNLFSIIILTFNEEIHIERCIRNASLVSNDIFVIDSYSTDRTVEIAKKYTKNIYYAKFDSFSSKLNWAIANLPISSKWTIRLDADEIFCQNFIENVNSLVEMQQPRVTGIYVRRQLWFLNKWMRHGAMYPVYSLRIWRTGLAICENRLLDEHMILKEGVSILSSLDIIDDPKISINLWIQKHNKYSDAEVISLVHCSNSSNEIKQSLFGGKQNETSRYFKNKVYYKMPLFIRAILYFLYRYFFKLGFLDGKEGFIWHILHGFWYRLLIDVKIYELRKTTNENFNNYGRI